MKNMTPRGRKILATVLLFVVAIVWGSGFIVSQMALDANASPQLVIMGRFFVATVAMGLVFFKRIKADIKKSDILPSLLTGVFLFLGFIVQIFGLQYTTPANNAFLTAANVVMVPFIWWALVKKAPPTRIFIASVICLAGIGILSLKLDGMTFSLGDMLTLLCAFLFACQIVATGYFAQRISPVVLVFLQFLTATILGALVVVATGVEITPMFTTNGLLSIVYLGIFSTCVCYLLQTISQRHVSSSKAAIIMGTEALFGSLFSVIMGYDALTVNMMLGGGVIMVALILTEYNPKSKNKA